MPSRSAAGLPRKPLRYRPRSPQARERRQAEIEPETAEDSDADEEFTSGSEDEFESDSENEDEPLPPTTTPTPTPTETSASAITTFRVDKGGVIATELPDASEDVVPPVNAVLPEDDVDSDAETGTTTASEPTLTESVGAIAETTVIASSTTSASASASSTVDKEFNRDDDDDYPGEVMQEDDTKRHVVIGVGSIGAFIGVCVLAWLFWRFTRARKRGAADGSPWPRLFPGGTPRFPGRPQIGRALARVPWVRSQPWAIRWQARGDEDAVPIAEKSDAASVLSGHPAWDEKAAKTATAVSLQRVVIPPLDTSFNFGIPTQQQQQQASPDTATVSPLSAASVPAAAAALAAAHQAQPSFGSLDNQGGTWVYVSPTRPPQRNRNSELSSLSSGFGDGEIIVPAAAARAPNRDTVYTTTSEDQPARFRTVDSWVDQQKGRIHRARERARDGAAVVVPGGEEGVPPVPGVPAGVGEHGLPPEPVFNMMMPDGEVPRRVEER